MCRRQQQAHPLRLPRGQVRTSADDLLVALLSSYGLREGDGRVHRILAGPVMRKTRLRRHNAQGQNEGQAKAPVLFGKRSLLPAHLKTLHANPVVGERA
jgi:hypothetical protein